MKRKKKFGAIKEALVREQCRLLNVAAANLPTGVTLSKGDAIRWAIEYEKAA